jgi:hypothetical protein
MNFVVSHSYEQKTLAFEFNFANVGDLRQRDDELADAKLVQIRQLLLCIAKNQSTDIDRASDSDSDSDSEPNKEK